MGLPRFHLGRQHQHCIWQIGFVIQPSPQRVLVPVPQPCAVQVHFLEGCVIHEGVRSQPCQVVAQVGLDLLGDVELPHAALRIQSSALHPGVVELLLMHLDTQLMHFLGGLHE